MGWKPFLWLISRSKPNQTQENGWNMTHDFFHCPGVLKVCLSHKDTLCVSLCVGLEQFLHVSLTINISLWCSQLVYATCMFLLRQCHRGADLASFYLWPILVFSSIKEVCVGFSKASAAFAVRLCYFESAENDIEILTWKENIAAFTHEVWITFRESGQDSF